VRNAILVHGRYSKRTFYDPHRATPSNDHWFPWLTKQLMMQDIHTVSIEMPRVYDPRYDVWKHELERYNINENTILVGHSCGGGFLLRWLSEADVKVSKVALVAPWIGHEPGESFDKTFFDFTIDPNVASRTTELHMFWSDDDMGSVLSSVDEIKGKVKDIKLHEFQGKKHFTLVSMGGPEFPELVEELLKN